MTPGLKNVGPVDPVTLEVLRNRFDMIANRMQVTLQKCGYSTVIKEGADCSVALLDCTGDTVAQGVAIPLHLGSISPTVKAMLNDKRVGSLEAGDVIVTNDPYLGTQHLPDVVVAAPIFSSGRIVAMAAALAHQQDIGGKSPGSTPTDAIEIFQEGLRIPPLKIIERGVLKSDVEALIRANVRIPDIVMGDIYAQIAAVRVAADEIASLCELYTAGAITEAMTLLMDRAELQTRAALEKIPDGAYVFEDWLDNDGVEIARQLKIRVKVTISGSDLRFDFTGSAGQVQGPINAVPAVALSVARYIVRAVTDPEIPNNEGCYRMIEPLLPEGSLVNPRFPAAVNSRSTTQRRVGDAIFGALAQAIPESIPAASNGHPLWATFGGVDPESGKPFIATEIGTGGMGARPTQDGVDCIATDSSNAMNVPIEMVELAAPLRVACYRIRSDSGGPGRFRGGCGFIKEYIALADGVRVSHRGERHFSQPWGLAGGSPGLSSKSVITRANGRKDVIPSKQDFVLNKNDRLRLLTSGGGGHGDPLERPPELVLDDVLDGKISARAARDAYGAVLKRGKVDIPSTLALRLRLREETGGK